MMNENVRLLTSFEAAARHAGEKYSPVMFGCGKWDDGEIEIINAAFKGHVPERVAASFNMWTVYKYDTELRARQLTRPPLPY
jgi:hypothetical protein